MVTEDRDDRDAGNRGELAHQHARLLGQAVVRQIAAKEQDVRVRRRRPEYRLERPLGRLRAVKVTDGGDAHCWPDVRPEEGL